jgi:putative colanic acid biosynthesis UDP-glucose lipid carrier transferase
MVNTGHRNKEFPHGMLIVLRRASAAIVTVLSLRFCMWVYEAPMSEAYQALVIIAALLAVILFPARSPRDLQATQRIWSVSLSLFMRWGLFFAILLLLGYGTKTSSIFSRMALFTWLMITPPLLVLAQVSIDILIARMMLSADNIRRVVIAGANELGQSLAKKVMSTRQLGMNVEGFFDDRSADRLANNSTVPVLGNLKALPGYVQTHGTDVIFIAMPMRNIQRVTELLDELRDTTASIYFVPDIFVFDLIQCRTTDVDGIPVIALCETPFQGTQGVVKRFSDYVIASIILLLTSPLMIAIAVAIKLTSPGKVIFKQRRYGLDGREIVVYKFRSMSVTEDSGDIRQATQDDDRVTRVGAFLRKYSLDELPQFINVLQGRMSVVGPRPHAVAHNEEYRPLVKGYMIRHKVNPGITGLAQVLGYRGETKTVEAMQKRVDYDLEYLRNWSLTMDLRIIAKTISLVFRDKMAY